MLSFSLWSSGLLGGILERIYMHAHICEQSPPQGQTVIPRDSLVQVFIKEEKCFIKGNIICKCPLPIVEKAFCLFSLGHSQGCSYAQEMRIVVMIMLQQDQPALYPLPLATLDWKLAMKSCCFSLDGKGLNVFIELFLLFGIKTILTFQNNLQEV